MWRDQGQHTASSCRETIKPSHHPAEEVQRDRKGRSAHCTQSPRRHFHLLVSNGNAHWQLYYHISALDPWELTSLLHPNVLSSFSDLTLEAESGHGQYTLAAVVVRYLYVSLCVTYLSRYVLLR